MRVALAGNENWPFQIFMEIGAADTAPSDINQHLVRTCGRTVDVLYPNVFLIIKASCSHGHGHLLESIHNARIPSPLIVSRLDRNRNSEGRESAAAGADRTKRPEDRLCRRPPGALSVATVLACKDLLDRGVAVHKIYDASDTGVCP